MFSARSIDVDHKDLIHDIAYDYYGRRMTTCSSDQSVKVWDFQEDGQWHCTANWKAHSGSVWKVTWAHPEFGQVIATCSFDRTAAVWEEFVGDATGSGQSHWVKRTSLVDGRTSVSDVKFAPKYFGLQLATCSADGVIRIYEAPDVMNLSQWSLQYEINCKLSCSCLTWSPSRVHQQMIAVGSDDTNPASGGKVFIYEYNDNARRWGKIETMATVTEAVHDMSFAPNMGRTYHILAIASKDVRIVTLKPIQKDAVAVSNQPAASKFELRQVAQFDDHNSVVWRVSWNVTGTILASSGDDGCVRLWKANFSGVWKCISVLKGDGSNINADAALAAAGATGNAGNNGAPTGSTTTKYYKLGAISHPSQYPWH